MRVIYAFLALAQIRLSLAEFARADMLGRLSGEAIERAYARRKVAAVLARRAGLPDEFNRRCRSS